MQYCDAIGVARHPFGEHGIVTKNVNILFKLRCFRGGLE
jgi:hypothetical protein